MPKQLDFTKPLKTRGGSDVRIYEVFNLRYTNGAYFDSDSDVWWPAQWDYQGKYTYKPCALDLVNG